MIRRLRPAPLARAFALAALAALAVPAVAALPGFVFFSASDPEAATEDDGAYQAGKKLLDAGRFADAAEAFREVVVAGGAQADDALYWRAYALHKAGRKSDALLALRGLRERFRDSPWLDDAEALEVEVRGPGRATPPEELADEELKLYAINGLMDADPERAVPLLQKFLRGKHSLKLKERALFVLSQSDSPEGRKTLHEVARGAAYPELRRKAVEYLGIAGEPADVEALREIYRAASDPVLKVEVLDAFLVADAAGPLLEAARGESDPRLRRKAIELLGAMEATGELRQLYRGDASPELKLQVIEALGVAGDVETLAAIARQDGEPRVRKQAIHGLGISEGPASAAALKAAYAAAPDRETRLAVIEAFFIQDNARALIEIFRTEKDPALRREAVQKLTMIDSPESMRFLESVLEDND